MEHGNLYSRTKSLPNLRIAWHKVRAKALLSKSERIRKEAEAFDIEIDKHLNRIQRHLSQGKFVFKPAVGRAIEKSPGKKRPLVVAPLDSRIVQRAILQTLQEYPPLKAYVATPFSCGGIPERGVRYGLEKVHEKLTANGNFYLKSDIISFFTRVPKQSILSLLKKLVDDPQLMTLIEKSLDVVLVNEEELGKDVELFPDTEIGVAQGSCLSPLLCNILLNEFDAQINSKDVLGIRYIDDFIIIGPSAKAVYARFQKGKAVLSELGLEIYDPRDDPKKASSGEAKKGFDFLGCTITPSYIMPTSAKKAEVVRTIKTDIDLSLLSLRSNKFEHPIPDTNFLETVSLINNTLKAWGNQYQFCNHSPSMKQLDLEMSKLVGEYIKEYSAIANAIPSNDYARKRRLLGVHLLSDSKSDPIIKPTEK